MNRKKTAVLAIGTVVMLFAAWVLHNFVPLLENAFYDLSFIFHKAPVPAQIVIVGVDSRSIREAGGWPLPRSIMAALVRRIESGGPKAIALDFLFPRRSDAAAADDSLESAFAEVSNLVLPFRAGDIYRREVTGAAVIPQEALAHRFKKILNPERLNHHSFYYTTSVDIADSRFIRHANRGGFLNVSTRKGSQKVREVIHVIKAGNEYFPSFAMAAVAAYSDCADEEVALDARIPAIQVRDKKVRLTSYAGSTLLHYRGRETTIPTVSAVDVLTGTVDASVFTGKLVFVGLTDAAAGIDFFITPVSPQFPGVEIWATAAADILTGAWIQNPAAARMLNLLVMLALFPGLALAVPHRKKQFAVAAGGVLLAGSVVVWLVLFRTANIFWNPGYHVYAWVFSLLWLALQQANPTLVEVSVDELEPSDAADADTVPPPKEDDFLAGIPSTTTAQYVVEKIRGASALQAAKSAATLVESDMSTAIADEKQVIARLRSLAGGTIVRTLGSGGMADVYLVWNPRLEVYRAVKVIKPNMSDHILERFETEIRIFANLNHRNIVHCYNAGDWHTLPYLEMEYVPGAAMDAVLSKCKVLTAEQAIAVGILVCRALHYAHRKVVSVYGTTYKGVIHRDLKPANIMLSRAGKVKLTDFGIARPQAVSIHTADSTRVVGTLPYLAPEQLDGKELTARTDIYALGVTLFELVTGERAYPQTDVTTLISAKTKGQVRSLRGSTLVPAALAEVIEKATATSPQDRFESAQAMEKALSRALEGTSQTPASQFLGSLVKRFWGSV